MKPAFIRPNKRKGAPLARKAIATYTASSNRESVRGLAERRRKPLEKLKQGKAVILRMTTKQQAKGREGKPLEITTPVILTPGPLIGLPAGSVLVSVIGKGAQVIAPPAPNSLGRLLLAGIPRQLAEALLRELSPL